MDLNRKSFTVHFQKFGHPHITAVIILKFEECDLAIE